MKILLLIFVAVPLIEIYFLIKIGAAIGSGTTILLTLATAVAGAMLVRAQGVAMMQRMYKTLAAGEVAEMAGLESLVLFIGGALLLTPGFFTDALGFLLLVVPLRRAIIGRFIRKYSRFHSQSRDQRIIDADYKKID